MSSQTGFLAWLSTAFATHLYLSNNPSLVFHVYIRNMATPATQKALLLPARAGKWYVGEVPVPKPGPQDVLVKIMATALNPADWKFVDSFLSAVIQEYPFISGTDAAGIVEEVGAEVTTLQKGDRM